MTITFRSVTYELHTTTFSSPGANLIQFMTLTLNDLSKVTRLGMATGSLNELRGQQAVCLSAVHHQLEVD